MAKEANQSGVGLCPFSWTEQVKPAGCLSSIFGGGADKLITAPHSCMQSQCQLWDAAASNCGLISIR